MKKGIIWTCLVAVTLSSCSKSLINNEIVLSPEIAEVKLSADEFRALRAIYPDQNVSMEQAIKRAGEVVGLRKSTEHVAGVEMLTSGNATKASGIDTTLFVVNFADNGGYAVVSGEVASDGVIAYSDSGNFTFADTMTNNVKRFQLELIRGYQSRMRAEAAHLRDSLGTVVAEKMNSALHSSIPTTKGNGECQHIWESQNPPEFVDSFDTYDEMVNIVPLLAVDWEQHAPYNKFTPYGSPTGCVATALAQIMSYHKRPTSYNGYTFDWVQMTSSSSASELNIIYQDQITRLMIELGTSSNLNMSYSISGSSSSPSRVAPTLANFGYYSSSLSEYNLQPVKWSLDAYMPVYARGQDPDASSGHGWVIDGYKSIKADFFNKYRYPDGCIVDVFVESRTTYFLHNNWGWGSYYNYTNDGTHPNYMLEGTFKLAQNDFKEIQIIYDIHP